MAPLLTEEEAALDPYALLNIDPTADDKAIRKAYRQTSLKYHPDRNPDPAAAIKFREISLSLEILIDGAKRAYLDTRLAAERQRKERYAELDKKRKKLVDDLNAREEEAKKARVEMQERGKRMQEEEGVKEAGRRMMEEAKARRAAAVASAASRQSREDESAVGANGNGNGSGHGYADQSGPSKQNGSSSSIHTGHAPGPSSSSIRSRPDITPASLSLTLQIPHTHTFYTEGYATVLSAIEQKYAPVAVLSLKEAPEQGPSKAGKKAKQKARKAIVQFNDWPECWACWKDHSAADEGEATDGPAGAGSQGMDGRIGLGDGIKAKWVVGETPEWVAWAEQQPASAASIPPAASNGTRQIKGSSSTTATAAAPSFSFSTAASFPSIPSFGSAPNFSSFGSSNTAAEISAAQQAQRDAEADQKKRLKDYEDMILFNMRRQERAKMEEQIRREEEAGEA